MRLRAAPADWRNRRSGGSVEGYPRGRRAVHRRRVRRSAPPTMTILGINLMWAIVLFGILLWTTACVLLNAALRRGMGIMGMALSYGVLVWMLVDLPLRDAVVTWSVFAAVGGALTVVYELWARRKYAGTARRARRLVRLEGAVLWPAMIPDAVGLMLNDAGILPADERHETHAEDQRRITGERPIPDAAAPGRSALPDRRSPIGADVPGLRGPR